MRYCHYTCDMCQRVLDPDDDVRYVVEIQVRIDRDSDGDAEDSAIDEDRDHLQEIADALEILGDLDEMRLDSELDLRPFHLCAECRERFLLDPLGRRIGQQLDFSKN